MKIRIENYFSLNSCLALYLLKILKYQNLTKISPREYPSDEILYFKEEI